MTDETGALPACQCGHLQAHHATVDLLYGPKSPLCEWRGCGCPRYLPSDGHAVARQANPREGAATTRQQVVAEVLLRHYESAYQADHLIWNDFASDADDILAALDAFPGEGQKARHVHQWEALRSWPPSWRCRECGSRTELRP